ERPPHAEDLAMSENPLAGCPPQKTDSEPDSTEFYRRALQVLRAAEVPFLVAGAYGLRVYTAGERDTKDLDIFLRRQDRETALAARNRAGLATEVLYPHWLARARSWVRHIDLIFNMANGLDPIDDTWFVHAVESELLAEPVLILPPEEMICSKLCTM